MIIKLETLLENGIIDPNKITELVCDGKTVYKGYSDDIASFGKDYEFIKFNNTVNESFNTPAYTIEVKAKHPVNESFTSKFGLKTKADVIKSMKYFDYYDEDKKDALLEEIDYLCDLYNIDEGFDFVLDNEINNYVDIDVLTEKLTKYNVDRKLNKKIDKESDKNYTSDAKDYGFVIGWLFGGIIGGLIGRFVGHKIAASIHQDKIDKLYAYMKNDSELIGISNRIKSILNNDKLSKEDKDELKVLRKSFSSRLKVLRANTNAEEIRVRRYVRRSSASKELLQEWLGKKKQEKETKSIDNIKDDAKKEPENTKTVTIDRSKNEFGQWKSYDAYKANEKKEADEARAGVLRNEKKKEEYFAKHPKAPDPNTYWDSKNKCLRDKDTNEVVKKTKYSPATLREDVEQIDEEVLNRILLERPLINTDKFDENGESQDLIDYPSSRKIIYGKDEKTEKQLKKNVNKFNGKTVRDEPTSSIHTIPYTFYKKESAKDAPISNWKYVSDKDAEKYARKAFDYGNRAKRLEVDEKDIKRITDNDSARIINSKRDFSKDAPNTDKSYTDGLEARLKKAKEDVNKEEKKDKK